MILESGVSEEIFCLVDKNLGKRECTHSICCCWIIRPRLPKKKRSGFLTILWIGNRFLLFYECISPGVKASMSWVVCFAGLTFSRMWLSIPCSSMMKVVRSVMANSVFPRIDFSPKTP